MPFVERLHPRDGDGKFAREPGGGRGGMQITSRVRNGPAVVQHRPEQRRPPAPTAAPAGGGDGVWAATGGTLNVATIGGNTYHLKRSGGQWSVFLGDPADKQRITAVKTLPEAKAAAQAHAAGTTTLPPATPPAPAKPVVKPAVPARPVPPADAKESVATATRGPRVSPTTAQVIRDARAAMPASTADGWHKAATITLDATVRKKLADDAARLDAEHQGNITKLNEVKEGLIRAKVAQLRAERDRGELGVTVDGKFQPLSDARIDKMASDHAVNSEAFLAQQRIAITSLMASSTAQFARDDADSGDLLPHDEATGLLMPSPKLNAALDTAMAAGRAFLADAKREFERTATPTLNRGQAALARIDALTGPIAAADKAFFTLKAGNGPVDVALPDGTTVTLTHAGHARDVEERLRDDLRTAYDEARPYRRAALRHQQQVLLAMLAEQRPMGGVHHDSAYPLRDPEDSEMQPKQPRADWRERLAAAEAFFPDTWLTRHADEPLSVGASNRAYYTASQNHISFPWARRDEDRYDGGFPDKTGEIAVHELGHRMERYVPGLTALEFAFVRRRATRADGTVEPVESLPGYDTSERGQKDDWGLPYAGKSYERAPNGRGPHERAWEVFQVGLQDTFGRGSDRYGRKSDPDELQAFVIGALLTL